MSGCAMPTLFSNLDSENERKKVSFWRYTLSCLRCCWVACCPPLPGPMIRKVAFTPPRTTYHFTTHDGLRKIKKPTSAASECFPLRIVVHKKFHREFTDINREDLKKAQCFFARTSRGNWIPCLFYPCPVPPVSAKFTILYSHPNGHDLGGTAKTRLNPLSILLQSNICLYDYSGYGLATGRASEKDLYADIRAAYTALLTKYKLRPKDIIVMGQSLGVAASVDLAKEEKELAGVVLVAGFCSALNFVDNSDNGCFRKNLRCIDQFKSLEKMKEISAPVLVIHGRNDELVPLKQGLALHEKCKNPVAPLWHSFAGHNDIDCCSGMWSRIQRFIADDLEKGKLYSQIYRQALEKRLDEKGIGESTKCVSMGILCPWCFIQLSTREEHVRNLMFSGIILAMAPWFLLEYLPTDPRLDMLVWMADTTDTSGQQSFTATATENSSNTDT